jgi:hypothetical protein
MENLIISNPYIGRNVKFRSFFTTMAKWRTNTKTSIENICAFNVTHGEQLIGRFEFAYTEDREGLIQLTEMRIDKFDNDKKIKISAYNFATNTLVSFAAKKEQKDNRYRSILRKLINWFCKEYEINALRKTELSLFITVI